jgi:predicted alpha/beta-hydrolase family hydrolase
VPGFGAITAIATEPTGDSGWQFMYAPGAGSNVHDPFGTYACRALAEQGFECHRFQFPFQESGKKSPDRPSVLEETWRAVIAVTRSPGRKLIVGGRSMGGRIASQVVAAGEQIDALSLFAYPLHAPGKPDQPRDAHLSQINVPVLFCSGTADAFASPSELKEAAVLVPRSSVHLLEGADHGFNVKKASGRTRQDVWEEAALAMREWLMTL